MNMMKGTLIKSTMNDVLNEIKKKKRGKVRRNKETIRKAKT